MKFTCAMYAKRAFSLLVFAFIISLGYAQTTYTWIGPSGGSWATTTNWSPTRTIPATTDILQFNDGGTYSINSIPTTQTIRQLLVSNNTTINLQQTAAATLTINGPTLTNNLVVAQGSTLSLASSTGNLTITMTTTASQRADISGTVSINTGGVLTTTGIASNLFTVNNTGVVNHYGGTITASAATLTFAAGSNYNYLATTGAITVPTATWDAASNFNITGITTGTTTLTGFSGQSYGNVTYNCASQTGPQGLSNAATATIIKGDFNIINTGTSLVAQKAITTAASTLNVNGNINISGGQFVVMNAITTAATLTISGDYIQTNGTFNPSAVAFAPTINFDGNYNQTGGTFNQTGTTASTINFRGANKLYTQTGTAPNTNINYLINTAGASLTLNSGIVIPTGRTFTVTNGALYCGTNIVSGAGTFTLTNSANATLGIGSPAGITLLSATLTGNIQTTGGGTNRSYGTATAANYVYTGTAGQITGTGLPLNITGSVTVNLSDGGALTLSSTGTFTIAANGVLRMINGSLANTASFNQTSGTLEYAGIAAQTSTNNEFPATNGPARLVINNPNGVTLHAARNLPTAGSLTLTSGLLNTTSSNILTILNTAAAGIAGGSANSYVNGPLIRSLPGSLTGATAYAFPVGKGAYQVITLNPRTAAATTITAEVFDASTGGTAGTGIASLNSDNFWRIAASNGNLTSAGVVSVNETLLSADNKLCYSTTQSGTYSIAPSNVVGDVLTSVEAMPQPAGASNIGYYVIGVPGTLSGTIPVGNSSSVQKLYQIANLLNSNTITGDVIFELQADYDGTTGEIFPITFYPFTTSGGSWSATVRPAAGVSMRTTSGGTASTNLIVWDGVDRLTFDGRPGGVGSAVSDSRWTIRNTTTSGASAFPVLKFIDDATYNTIQYCYVEGGAGATNGANSGIINMVGGTTTTGNDFNTIAYNRIAPIATNYYNGIYSNGNSGTASNSDNTVIGNEVFNFSNSGIEINGVGNGNNWTISNNSVYSTVNTTTGVVGIQLNSNASTGNNITDNYVGGKAALGGVGNQPWIHTNGTFTAITIAASNGAVTTVSNNKVQNISVTSLATINGIIAAQGMLLIDNNTVGHATDATLGFTSGTTTLFNGIVNSGSNNCTISNNTVANVNGTGTASTGVFGIYSTYASSTGLNITGNKVYNISSASTGPLTGINTTATGAVVQNISGNLIHSLYSTNATAAVLVNGISFVSSTTLANNNVRANLIHSLSASSTNTGTTIRGIYSSGSTGAATYANNMVRLGIDRNGSNITSAYIIVGIDHAPTTANNAYYYNSVQIAGTSVASTVIKTYAFRRTAGTAALNIRNNIFVNDRSNATTGGAHIAMGLSAITGVTSNNNLFNAGGTNGALFELATTTYNTLGTWNTASSNQDLNSYIGTPGFVNALGNAAAVDLHINPSVPTQVEANAFSGTGIAVDYDSDARTSPDIGADEGAFTPIDLTAPVITYTAFPNACNDVTTHTVTVTNITDASGVNATIGTAPRVYYKKSTDANTYVDNTSATNGWKYVETANTSAPYSFTLDFTKLNSSIGAADIIQYFVVAQDLATPNLPNVAINSGTAAFTNSTNTVALTSAQFPITGTPNQFAILPCSGTITVGTGGTYQAFTTASGIFNAINQATLSGNLTINVVSNITIEDGVVALNQWAESGLGGYTVTIQSSTNANRDISSIAAGYNGAAIATNGLFRLNGADRVTFNGGTGTDRFLTFRNRNTGNFAATFNFIGDATNNTINNCIIEGAPVNTVNGVIYFGTGIATGNDNNTITSCDIRDLTTATATPTNAMFSLGSSAALANTNTITNNNIYNYYAASGVSSGLLLSTNNTGWTITGNKFYQTVSRTAHAGDQFVLTTTDGNGYNISNNIIGYADNAGGGTYTLGNGTTTSRFIGMQLSFGTAAPYATVSNNQITGIQLQTTSGGGTFGIFCGIYFTAGNATISGNTIGSSSINGAIKITSTTNGATTNGMYLSSTAVASTISNNIIGGIDLTGGTSTANTGISFYGINMAAGNHLLTGNTIGSATLANSVRLVSSNATSNACTFNGIRSAISASYWQTISNNTIANINNTNTGSGASIGGIICTGNGAYTVIGNNIYNLSTASTSVATTTSAAGLGIGLTTTNISANSISSNNIYNITCSGTANSVVTGIYYSGGSSTSNIVNKNLIYNLTSGTGTASILYGIHLNSISTAYNNMVRLGYTSSGAPITTTSIINGIYKDGTTASKIYFNSVYIGGTGVGTTATSPTYAFRKGVTSTPVDSIRNNIFVNERSNATTGSSHFAFWSINTTSIGSNYNLVYTTGTNIPFSNNGTNYITQLAWTQATNHDGNSAIANPNFVGATSTVADLHLANPSPAESAGIDIASITDDIDGDVRVNSTPVDMGADATNVVQVDIYKPVITYTAIPTQAPCANLAINVQVTVTDNGSGISLTNNKPRMYLRKSVGTPTVAWGIYPAIEGVLVSGNSNVSVWNFTLDFAALGISVVAADQFEYYFVAQDQASTPNIGYSQQNATTPVHSDVATQVTPPNFTLSAAGTFTFANPLSGTVTVGIGGTYTTFNGPSGLFNALNTRGLNGNLIVEVISDVNESGLYQPLGVIPEFCGSGYSVLIRPNAATLRTVYSTSGGNPLIALAGCKRVTFDGAFSGTGSYLTFAQRQNMPTFYFNGVSATATEYITIQNSTIEGNNRLTNSYGAGILNFAGLLGTGQAISNIVIDNNVIRNRSDLAQTAVNTPYILINMGGTTATNIPVKSNITISNNAMFNFAESAIQIRQNSTGNGIGNNISITGNKIYQAYAIGSYQYPIWLESGNGTGHVISNNRIGGNALPNPDISGTWTNDLTDGEIVAIYTLNGGSTPTNGTLISDNIISNMLLSGTTYTNFIGIRNEGGAVTISNNTIGSTTIANNISNYGNGIQSDITANSATIGIWNQAAEDAIISNNTVANIRAVRTVGINPNQYVQGIAHGSNQYHNGVDYRNLPGGKISITGNNVFNLSSGSRLASLLISPDALIGIFSFSANGTIGNEISNNIVHGLNATESWVTTTVNTRVYGIGIGLGGYGSTQYGTVNNNTVYDLNNNSRATTPEVNGILIGGGNWTVYNNTVSITNSAYTAASPLIQGLTDWMTSGTTGTYYHNSIYIGGTVSSGSNSSYAFCRIPDGLGDVYGANVSIKNNIFFNDRTGNSTNNVAIFNLTQGNSADAAVGWNSDYNFLVTRNTNQVGRWVGTTAGDRTFTNWQTTSGGDANSVTATITAGTSNATQVNPAELFISTATGNLHINTAPPNTPYPFAFVRNDGTPIAAVTIDIDNDPRDPSTPDIGCDEFTDCSAPTISMVANGVSGTSTICNGSGVTLNVSTSGSGNNCSGTFNYAISNGNLYWDGAAFTSSTPLYNSSYSNISFTPSSNSSYIATIACSNDLTCKNNSNTVIVNTLVPVTTVSAAIGTPANGTSHYIDVTWSAVAGTTGYDIDYSNNGTVWTNIANNISTTAYNHNTGDSPNVPTYYRVRPRNGSVICNYTSMATPVYTACDAPELPIVNNETSTTLNITLQAETPVANPNYTTYSIFCPTTNQYVQANGTLGSTEFFQTAVQWGTITVTGLNTNTNYCFYATAMNMDGDKRSNSTTVLPTQQFNSNVLTQNGNLLNMWFAPNSNTAFSHSTSGGCSNGMIGYSAAWNNFWGNLVRTPEQNCSAMTSVKFSFDVSHSYFATQPNDNIRFYMWDNYYTSGSQHYYDATSVKINGTEVGYYNGSDMLLSFNQARTCVHVEVTFDFSAVGFPLNHTDKVFFYLDAKCNYNNSNVFSVSFDNISINSTPTTACATTLNCTTPVITTQPSIPTTVCAANGIANINVAATGLGLTYQWRKNSSNINTGGVYAVNSTGSSSTLTITNGTTADAGNYDVIVSNACSQSVTSNAVAYSVQTAISGISLNSNSPVCEGTNMNLSSTVSSGTGLTYNWSGPDGFTSNAANPTRTSVIESLHEGVYTITVSNVCNNVTASIGAYIHPNITDLTALTDKTQLCETDSLFMVASYSNDLIAASDVQWSWTGPNGFTANTQASVNNTLTASSDGTYTITATNACGVKTATSAFVTVDEAIEADAGPDVTTNVCGVLSVQLQSVGTGVWSEIGTPSSSFSPSNSNNNATVTTSGYGLKQYRWTVTNGMCTSEDDVRYFFNPAITATVSVEGCNFMNGDSVLISVTASGGSSTLGISPPAGSELILPNAVAGTNIFTMPMDGTSRSYTVSDGICTIISNVTPPPTHPIDIPYKNSQGFATTDCYEHGFNKWLTFRDLNNDAILSVNDNGNNLGKVTASLYRDATEPVINQTSSGTCQDVEQVAMKRHFVLQSTASQPFASDVSVRLYFSENELNDLVAASQANDVTGDDCTTYDNLTGLTDLYVTKYSGANEDGDYINNAPDGIYRVYSAASGNMQPSANGFATLFTNGQNHHYIELNVREFSELWLHGSSTGSALPVEMLYLKADAIDNEFIKVSWATAMEVNNNGFVVERSTDAQNWSAMGWVDGNNNSTIQQYYSYDDYQVSQGIVYYYRLKQVDNDGAYEYTGIVSAILNTGNQVLTIKDFMPNPAINTTQLVVISPAEQEIALEVFDVIGRTVMSGNHHLAKGNNTIPFKVNEWAAGTYTAVVTLGNEVYSKKIVVIK